MKNQETAMAYQYAKKHDDRWRFPLPEGEGQGEGEVHNNGWVKSKLLH